MSEPKPIEAETRGGSCAPAFCRVRILKNRHGNIARFLHAHRRNWWMMRPMRLGPQKVHICGICRRGVWTNHITGLEITPSQIVVMRRVTHPKQPNDQADLQPPPNNQKP